ncbi:invertase recombinase-like protein [Myxococcota bacterium]|nr:invertase recombinase-like protein [Myxococcota bacterium]
MAPPVLLSRRPRRPRLPFPSTSFVSLTLFVAACSEAGGGGGATGAGGLAGIRDMGVPVGGQVNGGTGGRETLPDGASNGGDAPPADALTGGGGGGGRETPPDALVGPEADAGATGGQVLPPDAAPGPDPDPDDGVAPPPPADAGEPPPRPDAAGPAPVTCDPVPGDLLPNGGFEVFTDGLPDGWYGAESNLSTDALAQDLEHPRCGRAALRLENPNDGHRRVTVAVPNPTPGRHTLRYFVRGHGEIRNAWYGVDYSSYTPAGYHAIDSDDWRPVEYAFTVPEGLPRGIEVVFSVRNTAADRDHLQIDDASLVRAAGACDDVVCEDWAECDAQRGACVPRFDRCADEADCPAFAACDADHRCAPRPGRCSDDADCAASPATPLCDRDTNTCVDGDPCAGVECRLWQVCEAGACVAAPDRCRTSADCLGALPACDRATATCVAADAPVNVVPNGGLEAWSVRAIPFHGDNLVPDAWYGLATPADTEIDPDNLERLDEGHSGAHACRITEPGIPADRFVTEPFALPVGRYTCGFWVRGSGDFQFRWYSGNGWGPQQDRFPVETDVWQPVHFALQGNLRDLRFIFYASNTTPAHGHIQLDDLVCTLDP